MGSRMGNWPVILYHSNSFWQFTWRLLGDHQMTQLNLPTDSEIVYVCIDTPSVADPVRGDRAIAPPLRQSKNFFV